MIPLRCPVCSQALELQDRSWLCPQRHTFDVAREGYVNLLLVQQKKSLEPGDNPEMVQARRDFLAAGFYAPLRDSALGLLRPLAAETLLDIGCGEGYYTEAFAGLIPEIVGLDIAKPAIQIAAKAFRNITWLVGSSAALPLGDASVDVVSSLFSPLPYLEIARVLKPGGHVLVATPSARHLWSMREALFDTVTPHEPGKLLTDMPADFTLAARLDIHFPLAIGSKQDFRNLLMMTPYAWRARTEKRVALGALEQFETEAAFTLFLLRKAAAGSEINPAG